MASPAATYVKSESMQQEQPGCDFDYLYRWFTLLSTRGLTAFGLPKLSYVPYADVELIHACQQLVLNKRPWVLHMVDHVVALGYNRSFGHLTRGPFRSIVEKILASPYCKKIIATKHFIIHSFEQFLDTTQFRHKFEVVPPAHPVVELRPRCKSGGSVKLLFISNGIYEKGGREVLQAFDTLVKEYDIRLTMVTHVPLDILKRYAGSDRVTFYPDLQALPRVKQWIRECRRRLATTILPYPRAAGRDVIDRLYREADIFVFPEFVDSTGVYLEAMAYGLPVVATTAPGTEEFIQDGVNGFLVSCPLPFFGEGYLTKWRNLGQWRRALLSSEYPEMVQELIEKLSILIEDSHLRREMGEISRKMILDGKFSIQRHNERLREIYKETLAT